MSTSKKSVATSANGGVGAPTCVGARLRTNGTGGAPSCTTFSTFCKSAISKKSEKT